MPTGIGTPIEKTLKYLSYSLNTVENYRIFTFYISGEDYLALPLDANVRLPSEKQTPVKSMLKTLESRPKYFVLQNSGINVISTEVKIDHKKKEVKLYFPQNTGIVNGGHTQLALILAKNNLDISEAKVKLEVLEHEFNLEMLAMIATGKNTTADVKPFSIAEKKGLFQPIKDKLLPQFNKHIIWYENKEVPPPGFSAVDLISLINLFNVKNFESDHNSSSIEQPNKSATGKNAVFKDWETHPKQFAPLYPLINDLINLGDHIQSTFDKNIPRGFTSLEVVKNFRNKSKRTIFTGKKIRFELPKQFYLPLVASIRANIKYDEMNKKIGWFEDPEAVFDKTKKRLIILLMRFFKDNKKIINTLSKNSSFWRSLYSDVKLEIDKTKEWKMYDV